MFASASALRILLLLIALQSALICLPLVYAARTQEEFPGITTWAVASLLAFVGLVLLALQGVVPDVVGVIAANTVALSAYVVLLRGLKAFTGSPQRTWVDIAVLVLLPAVGVIAFTQGNTQGDTEEQLVSHRCLPTAC